MKKIKLIKILAGFFALMLLFTFLSRAADSVNVAQVETKTAQNQVITHEVTGTGKVMGTRERAVFTQEGQKVEQVYVQEGQNVKKGDALLKFSVKYLKKTIKEKQDAIDVLQGKINDLISAESVNQQKRNNEFSDAQENYNSAVSSGNILLVIEDNGCGIKASDLSRVFEKGFTGSNRNKANATGMGLYLSKKLCDRLGLKLDIASTEKEYTRLTITFPKGTVHNFSE